MAIDKSKFSEHTDMWSEITKEEYLKAQETMSEAEFYLNYEAEELPDDSGSLTYTPQYVYRKRVQMSEEEIVPALLARLCEKQDKANEMLDSIRKMMIFFTVLAVISVLLTVLSGIV
ncbi:MAG: hypothetical protein J6A41_08710 [Ruminiclostridium sp.]|nr:hypothetical protein [Ruminiclostridium sp.]